MIKNFLTSSLVKTYKKLPLWAKIVVPLGLFVVIVSLINTATLIFKIGVVAVIVLAIMSLVAKVKKKD